MIGDHGPAVQQLVVLEYVEALERASLARWENLVAWETQLKKELAVVRPARVNFKALILMSLLLRSYKVQVLK